MAPRKSKTSVPAATAGPAAHFNPLEGSGEPLSVTDPLGPAQHVPVQADSSVERAAAVDPVDPEAQALAGVSPADMEISTPPLSVGEVIKVKVNPETPSQHAIDAATAEQFGPPKASLTITDGSGDAVETPLFADDAALIVSRAAASNVHPSHLVQGHYSNPNLRDLTDEEREANEKAYAARTGGGR